MSYGEITYEVDGGVATLTLNRPEIRNAITGLEMIDEIEDACRRTDADPSVSVLIVTGADPAFSTGGNVKDMRDGTTLFGGTPDEIAEGYRRTVQRIPRALFDLDVATIAAVNGAAVGAGCDITLMCDIRIASERARFGETFVNLGIIAGDGGSWFLPRAVGWQRAAELTFTGRIIEAGEALAMGMVLEVVPHEELMPRACALAGEIASKPPHAVRLAKRLLRRSRRLDLDEFLDLTAAYQALSHHTDDHDEAVAAFFEKRAGRYRGR